MVFISFCVIVLRTKVASALEGLKAYNVGEVSVKHNIERGQLNIILRIHIDMDFLM